MAKGVAIAILGGAIALGGTAAWVGAHGEPGEPTRVAPAFRVPAAHAVPRPAPTSAAKPAPAPAPDPGYTVKRILDVTTPFRHGDYYWDEAGVPDGAIVVTVDLAAQVLSVFRGGYEIGTAVIVYGADEKPTPLGVFAISQKDADHVSNLYDAPMPYMLRLTNDGISVHGSQVGAELMTHGCVGVPTAFAKKLFGVVKLGDKVIVSRGEVLALGDRVKAAS